MTNLDSVLKSKRHHSADKGLYNQCYSLLSGHMWVLRAVKKAERQRIDAFKLWFWRRLPRVPWTAMRSNQSILREINLNIWWKD